jgi:hypothetical protein
MTEVNFCQCHVGLALKPLDTIVHNQLASYSMLNQLRQSLLEELMSLSNF